MHVEVSQGALDVTTSRSEMAEGVGLVVLAVAALLLAGIVIGSGLILAIGFTAALIHSAIRYS